MSDGLPVCAECGTRYTSAGEDKRRHTRWDAYNGPEVIAWTVVRCERCKHFRRHWMEPFFDPRLPLAEWYLHVLSAVLVREDFL